MSRTDTPYPNAVYQLLELLRDHNSSPLGSVLIRSFPKPLQKAVDVADNADLVDRSFIPEDAPNYSDEAAGWRVSISKNGIAILAAHELRIGEQQSSDKATLAAISSISLVGHDLLAFLSEQPRNRCAIEDLPRRFLNADVLTVMDADRLLEFGHRNHCWVGSNLVVEDGWEFVSITGPNKKPMSEFIKESLEFDGDGRIREHVQLTGPGRVEASRLVVAEKSVMEVEPKPSEIENVAEKPKSRMKRSLAYPLISEHLCRKPHDTIREISETIGCSTGVVSESPFWKANRRRLQDAKVRKCDPIELSLQEYLTAEGENPQSQKRAHKLEAVEHDDEFDAQELELTRQIGEYLKANPKADPREVGKAVGCTAGEVEQRQAALDRLVAEQARNDNPFPDRKQKP